MFPQLVRDYSPLAHGQGTRQIWMGGVFYYAIEIQLFATTDVSRNLVLNHLTTGAPMKQNKFLTYNE